MFYKSLGLTNFVEKKLEIQRQHYEFYYTKHQVKAQLDRAKCHL